MAKCKSMRLLQVILIIITIVILNSSTKTEAVSAAKFVKKTIKAHPIVIFSKSYCPYCRKAKAVFEELNQKPYVVELDERDDGSDIQDALAKKIGRRTVPQVFIHGKHIGGSDDTVDAYQTGELAKLLGISESVQEKDDL